MSDPIKQVICIGYEPREDDAFQIAKASAEKFAPPGTFVTGIYLKELVELGLYKRRTETKDNKLWDVISEAPMSTEFAISRFLSMEVADLHLKKANLKWDFYTTNWVMFMDCDMLVRKPLAPLFDLARTPENRRKAVLCVKHQYNPPPGIKMDGQLQTQYARKNWSSVMLFNYEHPSNTLDLTVELINTVPGRDLHRFCWLEDNDIGELSPEYNYLVGYTKGVDPVIVHYTEGVPSMPGYENCEFSEEWWIWRRELEAKGIIH